MTLYMLVSYYVYRVAKKLMAEVSWHNYFYLSAYFALDRTER